MTEAWSDRLKYWCLALIPLVCIYGVGRMAGNGWFVTLFFLYLFLYKPALDIQRLLGLGRIEERDAWRFFIPLAVNRWKYNRSLWLG